MFKYKSIEFHDSWLVEEEFKTWLQRDDKDESSAFCKVYWKSFSIASSEIENKKQHAKGKKHLERCPPGNSKISFVKKPSETTNETEKAAQKTAQKQTSLIDLVSRDQTLNAEIIWSLEVLKCKYSYRSSESKSKLFAFMFPDSKIAENFTYGKTNCSYILCHRIAPFVKETLLNELKEVPYYTTLFDETYNKISKKGQMDLNVRFWDDTDNKVKSSYWNSEFLGKASADDVFSIFNDRLSSLDRSKILQVSSDGPNVNLAFLNLVHENRKDDLLDPLIDIRTCSLHTLHRSFQTGEKATDWNIKKLLSSINKIFHESPSRRAYYDRLTAATCTEYPFKFYAHRWIENASVAKRAQIIWSKIIEVVRICKGLPKSKQPGKGNISQTPVSTVLPKQ